MCCAFKVETTNLSHGGTQTHSLNLHYTCIMTLRIRLQYTNSWLTWRPATGTEETSVWCSFGHLSFEELLASNWHGNASSTCTTKLMFPFIQIAVSKVQDRFDFILTHYCSKSACMEALASRKDAHHHVIKSEISYTVQSGDLHSSCYPEMHECLQCANVDWHYICWDVVSMLDASSVAVNCWKALNFK